MVEIEKGIKIDPADDFSAVTEAINKHWLKLLLMIGTIFILWIASFILISLFIPKWSDRASFGDTFGAVNALFAGLALAGVITAILLQLQELRLQRKELEFTRKELSRSADAQEKSEKALTDQAKAMVDQAKALKDTASLNSLTASPVVVCDIRKLSFGVELYILNASDVIAFSVDAKVLCHFAIEPRQPVKPFLEEHIGSRIIEYEDLKADKEGDFHIHDSIHLPMLHANIRKSTVIGIPKAPFMVDVLLQFCDARGVNYYQIFRFAKFNVISEHEHVPLYSLKPIVKEAFPRVTAHSLNPTDIRPAKTHLLVSEEAWDPTTELFEFMRAWEISVPAYMLKSWGQILEERERRGFTELTY